MHFSHLGAVHTGSCSNLKVTTTVNVLANIFELHDKQIQWNLSDNYSIITAKLNNSECVPA